MTEFLTTRVTAWALILLGSTLFMLTIAGLVLGRTDDAPLEQSARLALAVLFAYGAWTGASRLRRN